MRSKLNGWQRLWVLVSLTALIPLFVIGKLLLPDYVNIKASIKIEHNLSPEAKMQLAAIGEPVGMKVRMPDGHFLRLKPNIEARKSTVVLHEYMSELDRILTYNRTIYILWLITGWIISCALLYSFGLGIAWVRRGFRMNDA